MSALDRFAARVQEQIASCCREPHWDFGQAERYMDEVRVRREQFTQIAVRLVTDVIQPRLATVASRFPNASPAKDEPEGHCSYWFGYCDRFPSSTKVEFRVEHDIRYDRVELCYGMSMMPAHIKLNERDKLVMTLEAVTNDEVAMWVEERLLDFLGAYLRIDRSGDDLTDEAVVDPVCGMRISRSSAAANDTFRGHPFFFCSQDCQVEFARNPQAFVDVKAM
jgi:YHS domain-containing protein